MRGGVDSHTLMHDTDLEDFQIMNKISKFSNQMTELTPSTDYSIEERKTPKKMNSNLEIKN